MKYIIQHDTRCSCLRIGAVLIPVLQEKPVCLKMLCDLVLRPKMRPEVAEVVRLVRDEALYRGLFKITPAARA